MLLFAIKLNVLFARVLRNCDRKIFALSPDKENNAHVEILPIKYELEKIRLSLVEVSKIRIAFKLFNPCI